MSLLVTQTTSKSQVFFTYGDQTNSFLLGTQICNLGSGNARSGLLEEAGALNTYGPQIHLIRHKSSYTAQKVPVFAVFQTEPKEVQDSCNNEMIVASGPSANYEDACSHVGFLLSRRHEARVLLAQQRFLKLRFKCTVESELLKAVVQVGVRLVQGGYLGVKSPCKL